MLDIGQTVAFVALDIAHIADLADVDTADFEALLELDDDKVPAVFDTVGLEVEDRRLEDRSRVDRADFVVDILENH